MSLVARTYVRVVITLGLAALLFAWRIQPKIDNVLLLILGCLCVLGTARIKVPLFKQVWRKNEEPLHMAMSLAFVPTLLLLMSIGPLAGVIAGACNMESPLQRAPLARRLFNAAAVIIPVVVAWLILRYFGVRPGWDILGDVLARNQKKSPDLDAIFRPLIGIACATLVYYLVNTSIVATVIALISKQSPYTIWRKHCLWMGPGYFAGASCATIILALLPYLTPGAENHLAFFVLLIVAIPIPIVIFYLYNYHAQLDEEKQARIEVLNYNQEELQQINSALERSKEELQHLYTSTVESLALAIDAKDRYTKEHIQRVKGIAVAIALEMGLGGDDLKAVETGALLHDIGKIAIPEHILTKPGRLSDEEFEKIKAHPEMGARILEPVKFPFPVLPIVRHHHEKWDGSGYPDGLAGENIPLGGRILAVADVYDALTSDRSYRRGWTHERAVSHLQESAGTHFDPTIVTAFMAVVATQPQIFTVRTILDQMSGSADSSGSSGIRAIHDVVASGVTSFEYLALYEISQALSTTGTLDEMLTILADKSRQLFEASASVILLTEGSGSVAPGTDPVPRLSLRVHRAVGPYERFFRGGQTLFGIGATGQAAVTGQATVTAYDPEDILTDGVPSAFNVPGDLLQSTLVAPLTADGLVIGTLNLYQNRPYAFDSEALRVLQAIALQAGRALQKAIAFDRNLASALTDALTGLYNARHLNQFLERELERSLLEDRPLSVLVLDLDNFKPVNDLYGHTWGNEVLRDLGGLFQGTLRSGDLVARYAGDEFVVVLPGTGPTEAQSVVEKIRAVMLPYDGRPANSDDRHPYPLRIAVSVGISSFPEDGVDSVTLVATADRRMFRDKKQRKGEIIIADELAARSIKLVA